MIRHAAQTFRHLVLTVLLLIGGVCALEVVLRVRRATNNAATTSDSSDVLSATTTPNRSTYFSVAPKLRFTRIDAATGRPFTLRTNSFGLRNPEVDIPRPEGRFRVLCLGDDSTFAGDLPEGHTYARLLGELIQGQTSTTVEILNAGCPGGCPTISALLLRHRLTSLQPDVIIVHVDPSDLADEEALRRHVERTAEGYPLAAMHPATAGRTNLAAQLDDELLLVQVVRDEVKDIWTRGQSGGQSRTSGRDADRQFGGNAFVSIRSALEEIRTLAQSQSIEVLVATAAPPSSASRGQKGALHSAVWPPQELQAICDELRLPLIDATPDIEAELSGEQRPRKGPLLSADAHQIYAEVLAESLLVKFTEQNRPAAHQAPARVSEHREIR